MVRLAVPDGCRVRQVVQAPQHNRNQRPCPPVAPPAVDVQVLALQHALNAVVSQAAHRRVSGNVAVTVGDMAALAKASYVLASGVAGNVLHVMRLWHAMQTTHKLAT